MTEPKTEPRSSTETIIGALYILAREIQSEDGVANAAIYEAAQRMGELVKERDQAVQSYAADRERFAAQEERHRVKITEQRERIRELVEGLEVIRTAAQIAPAIDPDNYDIDQVTELDSAMGKIYNIAKNSLAKYGRAGE